MLKHLYIKNYTLIEELNIDFRQGFSVITGETGAGKSIILGAIGLLLGGRADTKQIKNGKDKCTIEAHFDIKRYDLKSLFDDIDIDYDANDCIVRRELTAAGKSRAFVNDTPVGLATMKEIGEKLIDIHSQHQNLLLNKENFQLEVVDIIAENKNARQEYKQLFDEYKTALYNLDNLKKEIEANKENEDFLRFQFDELSEADLKEDEQATLEHEAEIIENAEDIKTALFGVNQLLSADNGAIDNINQTLRQLQDITKVFDKADELSQRIDSCLIELKDIAQEIDQAVEKVDFDPQRLEWCHDRLDKIYHLEKKYKAENCKELIEIKDKIFSQIQGIDNSDEALKELEERVKRTKELCEDKSLDISKLRKKSAKTIEQHIMAQLTNLGMPNVRFEIRFEQKDLSADGTDKVAFMFSANKNSNLQPVAQVASGGEIARVMLALKAMISGSVKLPTIIFDEIDTGVSGKIAEQMANIMATMGQEERQVISITHLPQIAAKGTTHYRVYKEDTKESTESHMVMLNQKERVNEIAQMLSGTTVTKAAIENAKQLLNT